MAKYLMKIEYKTMIFYLEWDTKKDKPSSFGMTLAELQEYVLHHYGQVGLRQLPQRLNRVKKFGTSKMNHSVKDMIDNNRAGYAGEEATLHEIIRNYCL